VLRWRKAPDGPARFLRDTTGLEATDQQKELFAAVAGFEPGGGKFGVSVTSGQGTGKTFALAVLVCWFLLCFENSLVSALAAKEEQVRVNLFGELSKLIHGSQFLSRMLEWRATRIGVRGQSERWSAIATTARVVENIQGKHRDSMLVIVDEASGVEDNILEGLVGGLTQPHNLAVLTSQGTRASGFFYDTHNNPKKRESWHRLRFDSEDSPLVPASHIERLKKTYGEDSPYIAIRVHGDFPSQSPNALVSIDWLNEARDRELFPDEGEPIQVGLDVARFGADSTVCTVRQGRNVLYIESWHGRDLAETTGHTVDIVRRYNASSVKVDEIGMGGGPTDVLAQTLEDIDIIGVNVGEAYDNAIEYRRLRDWLWFDWANRLQGGQIAYHPDVDLDLIEQLEGELVGVEYTWHPSGARMADSKDVMRKKMGRSPDIADSMMLAFYDVGPAFIGWV